MRENQIASVVRRHLLELLIDRSIFVEGCTKEEAIYRYTGTRWRQSDALKGIAEGRKSYGPIKVGTVSIYVDDQKVKLSYKIKEPYEQRVYVPEEVIQIATADPKLFDKVMGTLFPDD